MLGYVPSWFEIAATTAAKRLPQMEDAEPVPRDAVLTSIFSLCVLQERFPLS